MALELRKRRGCKASSAAACTGVGHLVPRTCGAAGQAHVLRVVTIGHAPPSKGALLQHCLLARAAQVVHPDWPAPRTEDARAIRASNGKRGQRQPQMLACNAGIPQVESITADLQCGGLGSR